MNKIFYEGKFKDFEPYHKISKFGWFLKKLNIRFNNQVFIHDVLENIKNEKQHPIKILDFGAGGGKEIFLIYGGVVGIDFSESSLKNAKKKGYYSICANGVNLPFKDFCFDLVFSGDVLGHIPVSEKDSVISEIHRVTREGGFSLHLIESKNDNQRYLFLKDPELFYKKFIELDGHFGLEYPNEISDRFRRHGFYPIREEIGYNFFTSPGEYLKRYDGEISKKYFRFRILVFLAKPLVIFKYLGTYYLCGVLFRLTKLFIPFANRSTGLVHVLYQKQNGARIKK